MSTTGPYYPTNPAAGSVTATSWAQTVVRAILYYQGIPQTGDDERPYASINQTVAQALLTGASAAVLFDSETGDAGSAGGGHSTTTNTSRWTCPPGKPGWYHFTYLAGFASNGTGDRLAWISTSANSNRYGTVCVPAASAHATYLSGSDRFFMNPGDYVQLNVEQYSGSTINTDLSLGGCKLTIVQERMQ